MTGRNSPRSTRIQSTYSTLPTLLHCVLLVGFHQTFTRIGICYRSGCLKDLEHVRTPPPPDASLQVVTRDWAGGGADSFPWATSSPAYVHHSRSGNSDLEFSWFSSVASSVWIWIAQWIRPRSVLSTSFIFSFTNNTLFFGDIQSAVKWTKNRNTCITQVFVWLITRGTCRYIPYAKILVLEYLSAVTVKNPKLLHLEHRYIKCLNLNSTVN